MESLYTKYRPQTFADVVGQSHVVTTLERAVMEGRTSHAYLFCGPRGTGKTTMARLLAKALMCEQGEGHLPDGSCEQCRMIAAGEHPDVYELDAASRTGVDNVRDEIISRVSFAPVRAPYKMYIIDEVHMLTTAAFNALLKTLEEPPSHVVFVLCTTDPQKIPETILSRVQRFDFHAISNADIQARLAYICEREGFSYDPEALELVVRHARGGMRDAISELEQLSVSGGGSITVDVARDVLGEVAASTLERVSMGLAKRDVPLLFAQVESLVEVGRDLLQFTNALAGRLRDVYVVAAIGAVSGTVQVPDDELPAISREAKAFGSVDRVARALGLLSDAATEMRVAPNQRLVLEVALTKIARPQSELTLEALADRVASLERQVAALSVPAARKEAGAPHGGGEMPAEGMGEASHQEGAEENKVPRSSAQGGQAGAQAGSQSATAVAVQSAQRTSAMSAASMPAQATPAAHARELQQNDVLQASVVEQASSPAAGADQTQSWQGGASSSYGRNDVQAKNNAISSPARAATSAQGMPQQRTAPARQQTPAPAPTPQPVPAAEQVRAASTTAAIVDPGELQRRWKQVVDGLLSAHPQHGSLLMSSSIVADDGQELTVSFPKGSMFAVRMLERADVRANVDPMVARVFGPRKARFCEEGSVPRASAAGSAYAAQPATAQPVSAPRSAAPTQIARPSQPTTTVQTQHASLEVAASRQAPVPSSSRQQSATASQQAAVPQHVSQQVMASAQQPFAPQQAPQSRPVNASGSSVQPASVSQQGAAVAQPPRMAPVGQAAQAAPAGYPAPWEPQALGDDVVPYDDFDTSPYEEDYTFGQVDDGIKPPSASGSYGQESGLNVEPMSRAVPALGVNAPTAMPAPNSRAATTGTAASAPAAMPASISSQAPASQVTSMTPASSTSAPVQDFVSQAADVSQSEPTAAQEVTPAKPQTASPAQEQPPKRKRARKVAGIPADIVSMMAEIFGEGVTYTAEPPEDETQAEEAVAFDGEESESEFVDEPVDDADFEDED